MGIQGAGRKTTTDVALDQALLDDAEALGVNVAEAAEQGVSAAVRKARGAEWLAENREAIAEWNDWVEKNGLPLEKYRMFSV